jgi:hypothetical protein
MTEAEYKRILAGFNECNRRMMENESTIARQSQAISTMIVQVQLLKDSVATLMVRVNDATRPEAKIKNIMAGDRVRLASGAVGIVVDEFGGYSIKTDSGKTEIVSIEQITRIK